MARRTSYEHHGMTRTPEYKAWRNMNERCTNPRCQSFKWYGARGIKVCERWRESFAAFYADLGPKPSRLHSIDREDPDGDYEPRNVRWATSKTQTENRRCERPEARAARDRIEHERMARAWFASEREWMNRARKGKTGAT